MKKNIALAILAALYINQCADSARVRKAFDKLSNVNQYYANMLDKNNVEITEFDRIAVMSLAD